MQGAVILGLVTLVSSAGIGQSDTPRDALATGPVVLISIDGLKPDYVLDADSHGLELPNLRRMVKEGAFAIGTSGVTPTVTYPSHTTMVTGVSPAKHGILTNNPYDPMGKNIGGWYWYAEDIHVPTLWDVAAKAGMVTSSVDWPVTVGANIPFNIAQYWRASTPDDQKIIRAVSTPGLLAEAERKLGPYPEGNDYTVAADVVRAKFNAFVIEKAQPRFHLCYFSGFDTEQHRTGPYSPTSLAVIEQIDALVGQVREAAEKVGNGRATICVVSDHGFAKTEREVHINAALAEAGLVKLNEQGRVNSWKAFAWYAGGSAGIILAEPDDTALLDQVRTVLKQLADNPDAGVERIVEAPEADKLAGFSGASFVVNLKPPFRFGTNLLGPVLVAGKIGGTHGYLPELREMDASFFLVGPQVPAGLSLGRIDMRDIAPTLAGLLQLELPTADGKDLLKRTQPAKSQ